MNKRNVPIKRSNLHQGRRKGILNCRYISFCWYSWLGTKITPTLILADRDASPVLKHIELSAQTLKSTESTEPHVSARDRKPSERFVDAVVSERTINRSDKETAALRSSFDFDIDTILQPTKKISKRKQDEAKFAQFVEEVNVRRSPNHKWQRKALEGRVEDRTITPYCSLLITSTFETSRCTFKQNSLSWTWW